MLVSTICVALPRQALCRSTGDAFLMGAGDVAGGHMWTPWTRTRAQTVPNQHTGVACFWPCCIIHFDRRSVFVNTVARKLAPVLLQKETTMNRGGKKILVVINGNNNKNSNACTTQVTSLENAAIDISGLLN
jgi:hypothetical protein